MCGVKDSPCVPQKQLQFDKKEIIYALQKIGKHIKKSVQEEAQVKALVSAWECESRVGCMVSTESLPMPIWSTGRSSRLVSCD